MEILQIFPYFTLFCFLLLIYKRSNPKKSFKTLPLPPGPWKLPLIGNIHQLIGSLPHHSLRNLANKYGPLMHLQLGETSNVIVTSSEIAKQIFTTHDLIFSNRPHLLASNIILYDNIDIGFSPHGNHWRQLRKICTLELFTAKRVRSFRYIREEEVSALLGDIRSHEGSVINLSEKIFKTTNSIIARAAFGKKSRDQEAFISTLKDIMNLVGGFSVVDLFPSAKFLQVITGMRAKLERIHRLNDQIIENIIKDHMERKATSNESSEENLLDLLLRIQQGEDLEHPLTHDHVKVVLLDMFIAGSETSSTTLEWAVAELMKNPKVMEKAQAEVRKVYNEKGYVDESEIHQLKYLNSIVKETLRLHPPGVLLLPRENTERCVINGYEIPEKTKIIVNGWAIFRDPKSWDDAETFKPERFLDNPIDFKGTNFDYIPFGAGRRICPGINLAIPNMELPLANLLYHFDWKLPNGMTHEEFDMSETFAASVRRRENLFLVPVVYQP
ncbi:cytochrome P450 71D10-like [Neltuma alba]|uniref:cytochrome P450 71D10-like n=1 Tax=Neltuma alba TaxID=207710 RepID=UPI0010A3A309|nr:cytochrome P450 71D10-like [Prosopis alba]XP_028799731.1 cytochrome P450 71D10-like [Prosopis alba]